MNYMRNQLGLEQIPQRPGPEDIYIVELRLEAAHEIDAELDWLVERNEDNGWSWGPDAE